MAAGGGGGNGKFIHMARAFPRERALSTEGKKKLNVLEAMQLSFCHVMQSAKRRRLSSSRLKLEGRDLSSVMDSPLLLRLLTHFLHHLCTKGERKFFLSLKITREKNLSHPSATFFPL
jgi:hypothetical protein